ncbi:sterile alpha motif domain-containing protein 1-like [Conger conger]|uniref:sterile alpha motif domain-containing protein 1-like n=1 Tax=Conger conger TaxID=82655 RepID=UPI002A5A4B7B|nr:sterile alpha motif domain-containing protein 1-like [Conger conger]
MSEPMYRDWILDTIDSLRSRKARPDLERICRMVRRRHGSDPERTRSELEKLIQEQTVLKVSYKGSISYRNAAKVQRKSRKKTEQSTGVAKDQSKNTIFNNGDSAHSSTDQGETGDAEITNAILCRDPALAPLPVAEAALVLNSGNSCMSVGSVVYQSRVHCATGSDGERTNSPKEKLPHTGGSGTSPARDKSTINNNGSGASGVNRGAREVERGLPELERSSTNLQNKTCTSTNTSGYLRQKPHAPIKVNPRAGATRSESESDQNISDLGDRLVNSVRSLVRRSRGVAALKGHAPLGLKEILGFLSSQERLSQEKLTRSKVKVVLEREVARGRLRRTRFGNITLPVRGVVGKSHARLLQSALQHRQTAKKEETGAVAMETQSSEVSGAERQGCGPQSAGAHGTTVPLCQRGGETEEHGGTRERPNIPGLLTTTVSDSLTCSIAPVPPPHSPKMEPVEKEVCDTERSPTAHRCLQGDAAVPQEGGQLRALCPSVQREMANGHKELRVEESAVTPDQLISGCTNTQGTEGGEQVTPIPPDGCMECKIEVGVASCLLTPTASPRDNGLAEDGGMKRGVVVKTEPAVQSPLEWSVSDVASYFITAGFPEQAAAFKVQEIDGKSLLLMQRNDVLTGLSIRLGPALKIYEHHVKMLQKAHFEDDSAFC